MKKLAIANLKKKTTMGEEKPVKNNKSSFANSFRSEKNIENPIVEKSEEGDEDQCFQTFKITSSNIIKLE